MKLKSFFAFCLVLVSSFFVFTSPIHAQTKTWGGTCIASDIGGGSNDVATIQGIECLFFNVLQVIVWVAGIAFLFMFINGGFQYMFSDNDPKKVAVASSTLTMAIAGLIGLIASFFILRFIQNFTGVNVTDFIIPNK